ncbi:hypothetical protein FAZ78_04560 [Cereibacter changlensis]|uniref:AtuA-like ferredoxin-fold domain-containing protein n=1 Tax=Cereibacter changlensis TaxID=402884 RepID=A0A4U0Z5A5_9RHOB|nr:hypothetical protein [Cereibacter changlensis]TKA97721.1 hypothetical protein FAZ78_04560 [Cereibacter changlensis]
MILREVAHARSGDKGNTANISVIAFRSEDYALLVAEVTADRVASHLRGIALGPVVRYEIPSLGALNFVLSDALAGGVVTSLALDAHGKSLGSAILSMEIAGFTSQKEEPDDASGA